MSDFPDPSIDYQSQSGDSEFQNMYVTGKLNYRFNNDDITMHTLNATAGITGNVTGNVTGNLTGTATNATTAEGLTDIASIDTSGDVSANRFFGNGESLVGITTILSGFIVMWSGSVNDIPPGYHLCDGQNGTPDLRNRFIVGAGDRADDYSPDQTDKGGEGADSITLGSSQLPSHSHSFSGSQSHDHGYAFAQGSNGGIGNNFGSSGISNRTQVGGRLAELEQSGGNDGQDLRGFTADTGDETVTISGTSGSTGSGAAIENRPPYYALCYIMKT